MTKPTKEDKIMARDILSALIEKYLTSAGHEEPIGVDIEMRRIQCELEAQKQKLINPPAPRSRTPRKPQARVQVADAPAKATFEPGDSYVNSMPKTGRNRP